MATSREERETLVVFSDKDRLEGGMAVISTFTRSLKEKAVRAGARITREHVRDGKVEGWDLEIEASRVKIGFRAREKSQARVEAGKRLSQGQTAAQSPVPEQETPSAEGEPT
jgi:hypothetical protein